MADWIKTISESAGIDATFYKICFYFQSKGAMAILCRYFEFASQQTALFQNSIGLGRCELNIHFYVYLIIVRKNKKLKTVIQLVQYITHTYFFTFYLFIYLFIYFFFFVNFRFDNSCSEIVKKA